MVARALSLYLNYVQSCGYNNNNNSYDYDYYYYLLLLQILVVGTHLCSQHRIMPPVRFRQNFRQIHHPQSTVKPRHILELTLVWFGHQVGLPRPLVTSRPWTAPLKVKEDVACAAGAARRLKRPLRNEVRAVAVDKTVRGHRLGARDAVAGRLRDQVARTVCRLRWNVRLVNVGLPMLKTPKYK